MHNNVLIFIECNRESLLKFIRRSLVEKNSAEDVLQEACLNIFQYTKDDIDLALAPGYAYTVVRRMCHAFNEADYRRMHGDELQDSDSIDLTFEQLHADGLRATYDPMDLLIEDEKHEKIPALIDAVVNEDHRVFLDLVLCQDVSIITAASLCDLSEGNARVILHRFMQGVK